MVLLFPGRFANKLVAITGGASGLGAAMAKRYINEGARVLIADMNEEKGKAFCAQFPKDRVYFHKCDISTPEGATGVVTAAVKNLGGLDIFHNNASAFGWGTVVEMDPAHWDRVFRVGIDATFYTSRAAIPEIIKRGGGSIINTASTCGLVGDFGLGCYTAVKAAIINLTRSMAGDHAPDNIRVNAIVPGWMDTPLSTALSATPEVKKLVASSTAMKRPAQPEEVAAAALFLASDDASFVTGTTLVADGGLLAISRMPSLDQIHAAGNKTKSLY